MSVTTIKGRTIMTGDAQAEAISTGDLVRINADKGIVEVQK